MPSSEVVVVAAAAVVVVVAATVEVVAATVVVVVDAALVVVLAAAVVVVLAAAVVVLVAATLVVAAVVIVVAATVVVVVVAARVVVLAAAVVVVVAATVVVVVAATVVVETSPSPSPLPLSLPLPVSSQLPNNAASFSECPALPPAFRHNHFDRACFKNSICIANCFWCSRRAVEQLDGHTRELVRSFGEHLHFNLNQLHAGSSDVAAVNRRNRGDDAFVRLRVCAKRDRLPAAGCNCIFHRLDFKHFWVVVDLNLVVLQLFATRVDVRWHLDGLSNGRARNRRPRIFAKVNIAYIRRL